MVVLATGMQPTAANAKLPGDLKFTLTVSSSMILKRAACLPRVCQQAGGCGIIQPECNRYGPESHSNPGKEVGGNPWIKSMVCISVKVVASGKPWMSKALKRSIRMKKGCPTKTHPISVPKRVSIF
jgi:hypothetical protein